MGQLNVAVAQVPIFAAHDQPDVAALTANGLFYRCFVYLDRTTWAVRAVCYRIQQNGTAVEVFSNIVARASAAEVVETEGVPLDCPKIIPSGTTFVVHWLQATDVVDISRDWTVHRATMDMTAFSTTTWTDRGAVALLETHLLYDVAPVIGHATDFVVTRLVALDDITVARYDGYDWVDTVWVGSPGSQDVAPRVLGVYAHEADNDLVVTYERNTTGRLQSWRVDADDGTNFAGPVETMAEFSDAAGESEAAYLQVGHCRVASHRIAVVVEALAGSNAGAGTTLFGRSWIHHLVYRSIDSSDCSVESNIHWAANLHMCSRPWAYAGANSASTPTAEVYVLASYRSCADAYERPANGGATTANSGGNAWMQAYHYALNLDFRLWDTVADGAGLRPRVIDTMYTVGIPDGRGSGWKPNDAIFNAVHGDGPTKRMNQVSYPSAAPPSGPEVKTRTIATVIFARMSALAEDQDDPPTLLPVASAMPEHADIHGTVIYMEDPHTVHRDSSDPTQPFDNFRGAYPRYMCQSTPVGRGLVYGGGTPYVYDGQRNVELGFPYFPEIVDWLVGSASGSQLDELTAGVHQIYAVYTWRDSAGQLHRSRPSNVVTFTCALDDILVLRVRSMTISLKDATGHYPDAPSISIELYATGAAATDPLYPQFYRVFGSDRSEGVAIQSYRSRDIPSNDPTGIGANVLMYFGLPDARLTTHQAAPTEFQYDANNSFNGPLPLPPPAMSVITTFQNRLWGADSLDPSVLWYSDEIIPEPGGEYYTVPEISSAQYVRIGDIGEVTGLAVLDTVLVVFTRNSIWSLTVAGQGPVTGSLICVTRPLHEGIGCISPRSIVSYPLGLRFQSDKGIYDLARSGEASYGVLARSRDQPQSTGGAALEEKLANAGNILAASHDPTKHQIRYVSNDRPAIVQTWTGAIVVGVGGSAGAWSISGLSQAVTTTTAALLTASQVGDALQSAVQALLVATPPDTLRFQVDSVTSPGAAIAIVLDADVELTLTGTAPGGGTITFTLSEALTATRPRVLIDHYDVQMATSSDLPQASSSPRYSEVVGACYWYGDTGARHVVQTQGATLIQRLPSETNAWRDEAAAGNVGIPLDVTFAWLSLAGLAGAQCWDELRVQTERLAAETIHAALDYDNEGRFDGQQILTTTYDWEDTLRGDLPARPRVRRVRSMRLRIYEDADVTTAAETVRILGLTAYVGVEKGPKRVNPTQRGEA